MGIIEAIKRGFGVAFKNIGLIAVLFVINLIFNLLGMPFVGGTQTAAAIRPNISPAAILLAVISLLVGIFIQGGALATVRDYIKEKKNSLGSFLANGLKFYPKLFSLGVVIAAITVLILVVAFAILAITIPFNNTAITMAALILALVIVAIVIYMMFLFSFSPYPLINEEAGVIAAIKTSVRLVRKNVLKVIGLLMSLILIMMGMGLIIGFIAGILMIAMPNTVGQIIVRVIGSLFDGFVGVVMMGSFMTLYFALSEKEKSAAEKVF